MMRKIETDKLPGDLYSVTFGDDDISLLPERLASMVEGHLSLMTPGVAILAYIEDYPGEVQPLLGVMPVSIEFPVESVLDLLADDRESFLTQHKRQKRRNQGELLCDSEVSPYAFSNCELPVTRTVVALHMTHLKRFFLCDRHFKSSDSFCMEESIVGRQDQ